MTGRRVIAVLAALLIAVVIVRNAAVSMLAQRAPGSAGLLWRNHPDVEIASAMTQIALAARAGGAAPASAYGLLARAAAQDPLAPEPYLVRGVQLELGAKSDGAQQAFEAAQWRDPRSLPAAYFLADKFVRQGRIGAGLKQIAALARLSPNGGQIAAPYLASFASSPANWPALRTTLRDNPELAEPTLRVLSKRVETVPALLALADKQGLSGSTPWLPGLLDTLIQAGQYHQAKAIWARAVKLPPDEPLHDPQFADKASPPPFNWLLTSNAVGLAERQSGGRLHVLYYGQEDGILATQLLTLAPGPYRLRYNLLSGQTAGEASLTWSIWCDKGAAALASVTIRQGAKDGLRFVVPANCPAQWLRLSGSSADVAQQSDATIGGLKLEAVPGV